MDWTIREMRCFVTAVLAGSLTEAAAELHVSQASVSRSIASLEQRLGHRVLRRGRYGCEATAFGEALLPQARRLLEQVAAVDAFAQHQQSTLVLGYAWAALGKHTTTLLRSWRRGDLGAELHLIQYDSPTAGLAEGRCDAAILRGSTDISRFATAAVGLEKRVAAFAADDPLWSRRRSVRLSDFAGRTVATNSRTGLTSPELWGAGPAPHEFVPTAGTDDWLNVIAAGDAVGVTSEATAFHHPRPGIKFVPIPDAARIPVRIAWRRDEPPTRITELVELATRLYASD